MPSITGPRFLTQSEIRKATTVQEQVLGSRAETLDGRIFRAMRVGPDAALVRGNLLQGPANVANHQNRVAGDNAAVGDMVLTMDMGNTAGLANDYADGYAVVVDNAGEGIAYHVGGHAAFSGSATSVRIELTEPIQVALTADSSDVSLHSIWRNVIQNPTAATNTAVGVADFAYAVSEFFWGQVSGVASVLQEMSGAASVMGGAVVPSDTTAGAVEITAQAVTALQEIGRALFIGADGEHQAVWLTLG